MCRGVEQRLEDLVGAGVQLVFLLLGLLGVVDEPLHARPRVATLRHLVEHHRMRHLHMRHQGLGGGVDELVERRLVPSHKPFGRLLALDLAQLLRVVASLGGTRFTTAFGKILQRLLRNGVGIHHAGMLPRYRRLVEQLAPRPAALGVAIEVEFVHRHTPDVRVRTLAQGLVRQDLCGAADDRCVRVD